MKRCVILIILVMLTVVVSGCATGMAKSGIIREDEYSHMEERYGIDKVFVEPGVKFGDYKIVKLEVSDTLQSKNELALKKIDLIKEYLNQELHYSGMFSEILVDKQAKLDQSRKALILKVIVTRIDEGNQAVRFLIGFGAGYTNIAVEGKAIDNQTGKRLMYFSDSRYGGEITGLQSSESLVDDDIKAMARNIVKVMIDNI